MITPTRSVAPLLLLLFLAFQAPSVALAQEDGSEPAATEAEAPAYEPEAEAGGLEARVDAAMTSANNFIAQYLFYPVPLPGLQVESARAARERIHDLEQQQKVKLDIGHIPVPYTMTPEQVAADGDEDPDGDGKRQATVPLVVLWLVLGAIFFTLRMGFIQLRAFGHAIAVTRGKYDNPEDEGEVSHFQALTAALSATVGLGNIGGVAIAISLGGPGATFWMILAGFLGMASKFTECTLGQIYRQKRPDGSVMGGAMYYLSRGLQDAGWGKMGLILAVPFAIMCMGGSFAGGNAYQVNQSLAALKTAFPAVAGYGWVYGLIMTGLVALVILGGLKRIAATAEKIVPAMCGIYVLAALYIILSNTPLIPGAFQTIWSGAFTPEAGFGGFIGVLVLGFQRAAFSNEAGVGSAAIAHSAAKTEYPVREGIVALLEPFIDTIVVCTMTALVLVITNAYAAPEYANLIASKEGAGLTLVAMQSHIGDWFKWVFCTAVIMFAFSTMISWSYYGERCWVWMFGDSSSIIYKLVFLVWVFLGSILSATSVLDFGDLMILGMAFPNICGIIFLTGKVKKQLDEYMGKLKAGEMKAYE